MNKAIKKIVDYKPNMKIKKNCIVRGMPNEVYHKMPALSNSGLKTLLECPAKYYYKYLSGEYVPKEKPHFKIGKAAHCYILEGREEFEKRYWVNPYGHLKKEEKLSLLKSAFNVDGLKSTIRVSELDEILFSKAEINPKETELTQTELTQVVNMAKAIKSHPKANNALSMLGESELSLFCYDEELEVWLKCRPDFMPYNPVNVPDYKTADSANPNNFYNKFIEFGYHIQASMYQRVIKNVLDVEVENFFFIVQEKEAPFLTQIYNPNQELIFWGEKAVRNAVNLYKECIETDTWSGYSDKIIELSVEPMPDYLTSNYDKENGIIYAPNWVDKLFEKYEV